MAGRKKTVREASHEAITGLYPSWEDDWVDTVDQFFGAREVRELCDFTSEPNGVVNRYRQTIDGDFGPLRAQSSISRRRPIGGLRKTRWLRHAGSDGREDSTDRAPESRSVASLV